MGTNSVFGRPLAEAHMEACLEAGLTISGINAEVRGVLRLCPLALWPLLLAEFVHHVFASLTTEQGLANVRAACSVTHS